MTDDLRDVLAGVLINRGVGIADAYDAADAALAKLAELHGDPEPPSTVPSEVTCDHNVIPVGVRFRARWICVRCDEVFSTPPTRHVLMTAETFAHLLNEGGQ